MNTASTSTQDLVGRFEPNHAPREQDALVSQLRDLGDGESWRTFFRQYGRLMYSLARQSGLNDDQAQEAVQETVIAVVRQMPRFQYDPARGAFKQWLLAICRRRIHDQLRRLYTDRQLGLDTIDGLELPSTTPAPDAVLERDWEQARREKVLRMALERVRQEANPRHYRAFDCCVLQAMRAADVAAMLGMTVTQVYLAKHRVSAAVTRAGRELHAISSQSASPSEVEGI